MKCLDVLIIGAGPVGLAAACFMAQQGLSFKIIEKNADLADDLRASTFHPPTLDMLAPLGLTKHLLESGLIAPSWQIRFHETGDRAEFDLSILAPHTDYPFRLQCEQSKLCHFASRTLGDMGEKILFGTTAIGIDESEEDVVTYLQSSDGEPLTIRSKFVVGADGGQSLVRDAMKVDFSGLTYPETTILATTDFPFENHLEGLSHVNYIWWQKGTFSLLKLPHLWRCSLYPDANETIEDAAQDSAVRRKLERIVPAAAEGNVFETRPYRIHMKIASQFAKERLLLVGDAAHLNSPSGGMGMNGGIHDAEMLARALGRYFHHKDSTALSRFNEARHKTVQQEIIQQADKNRARMQETSTERRSALFRDLQKTARTPELALDYLLKTSMINGLRQAEHIFSGRADG